MWIFQVPATEGRGIGIFLVAVGAMNIVLHRRLGRQVFTRSMKSKASFVVRFWERIGENTVQLFYLGLGIILGLSGAFLFVRSF